MDTVGEYLKDNRIKKKLSLNDISQELNIPLSILEDIENNINTTYINDIFLFGHIRSYSNFLDLESLEIINSFKKQLLNNPPLKEISKPIESLEFFSLFPFAKVIALFSFFLISFSFYSLFIRNSNLDNDYAITPYLHENLIASFEKEEFNLNLTKKKINTNNQNIAAREDKNFISSSSVIASIPNKETANVFKGQITLKFLNPTWVQLRNSEDEIIISQVMDKGDQYSYNAIEKLTLTSGNAGNIIYLFDGTVMGKIGTFGEVIESLIIDKNFKN